MTMTEERLLKYLASRKSWVSYETLAKYFCVDRRTVQGAVKKLEGEGRVQFRFGENGKKLWHLAEKPAAPDPVAVPATRVHRIEDGESRAAPKPRPKAPTQPQSWFSVLDR